MWIEKGIWPTLTHRSQTNPGFRFSSSQALITRRMTIETSVLDATLLELIPLLLPHKSFRSFFKLGRSSNDTSQEKIRSDFGISFHLIGKLIHHSYRTLDSATLTCLKLVMTFSTSIKFGELVSQSVSQSWGRTSYVSTSVQVVIPQ